MVYLRNQMGNVFFEKYFTINFVLNFLYIISNENPSMKSFCLQKYVTITKQVKIQWFCMCNRLHT